MKIRYKYGDVVEVVGGFYKGQRGTIYKYCFACGYLVKFSPLTYEWVSFWNLRLTPTYELTVV